MIDHGSTSGRQAFEDATLRVVSRRIPFLFVGHAQSGLHVRDRSVGGG